MKIIKEFKSSRGLLVWWFWYKLLLCWVEKFRLINIWFMLYMQKLTFISQKQKKLILHFYNYWPSNKSKAEKENWIQNSKWSFDVITHFLILVWTFKDSSIDNNFLVIWQSRNERSMFLMLTHLQVKIISENQSN